LCLTDTSVYIYIHNNNIQQL